MAKSAINLNRFLVTLKTTKRWWIPLTILSIALINLAGYLLPKKYEAQAIVLLHEPKLEGIAGAVGQSLTINDRINSIGKEMTSDKFLAPIASQLNLDAGIDPSSPQYDKLLQRMKDSITLEVKATDSFVVAYRDNSPRIAEQATRSIVDLYIEKSNNYYSSQTKVNQTLFEEELHTAQAQRDQSQEAVKKYKRDNINQIPETRDEHLKRLGELRANVQGYANQLSALRDSLSLARQKLKTMDKETTAETTTATTEEMLALRKQRQETEIKLNTLLQNFTEQHWDVKQARLQLDQLNKQIKLAETNRIEKVTKTTNKSYQELQDLITRGELDEKKFISQIATQTHDMQTLEQYLNNIPQHQAELDQLQRTLTRAEERVDVLEKRLDEAKITGAIERKGMGPSFEVLDPPRLPQVPVSPNRKKIAALSLVLGLSAGAALVYLLTLLDAAIRSVDEARRILQMPVLGVVQRVVTAREALRLRRRRRSRIIGLCAALLLVAGLLVASLTSYREPIQHSIESVRNYINQMNLW